jgi:AAT family amino acid transporter
VEGTDLLYPQRYLGYILAYSVVLAPAWLGDVFASHEAAAEKTRFLWYHAAEIAGFTLIPFLIWHHYFDDMRRMTDKRFLGASGSAPWACWFSCHQLHLSFIHEFWRWGWAIRTGTTNSEHGESSSGTFGGSFRCSGMNGFSTNGLSTP